MRFVALILALPLAAVPLAACSFNSNGDESKPGVAGSGSGTTRSYSVADFTGVELRGSDDVDVRVGTGFSVRAEGPSEQLDKLKIEKVGDTLRVGRINGNSFSWGSGDHKGVKIFVTMPRIAEASIAGSGDMAVDRVEGQSFNGSSAGSGNLEVAAINVETGKFSIAGSGDIGLKGSAKKLTIDIAGSGGVDAPGLTAQGAEVSIAGSGSVRATVKGGAAVSMMGSGDVDLGPDAKCATSKMGSGDVRCGS
jgi:hypothetical protein